MKDLTPEEEAFMEKHFKAGKYCVMQIMIPLDEVNAMLEALKKSNCNLVALPNLKNELTLLGMNEEGDKQ